ncbi:MAG TPA: TetR/AcrR family transcriptional regulator [Opitutae bacterium]|nr:TetR family transcriptional regulator [Puniceicoccaceae bacterium]HBR92970.1 TetR/AcrR family transcriptional regulator [Opitutae bacterium]|tara:strand:- start:7124 stop:7762 length:639 start_codon:yes stop_codon:yes gene_type:complete
MSAKVKVKVKRNPEKTKRALLDAGIELFSACGYDGVAVDEIVALAGCNKRMLYHYYSNKEGIYIEVLRQVFGELEAYEMQGVQEATDTATAIREILAQYFGFLQGHPEFVSLLMWENLNQAQFLNAHPDLLTKTPILERLTEILKQGAERGEIESSADPRHLLIALIGICFIYFSNQHTLRHSIGLDLRDPAVRKQGLKLAQDVLINGLIKS